MNRGVAGALEGPSGYLMKSPPRQVPDDEAYEAVERFIAEHRRRESTQAPLAAER
jgi:myo-inositol-1-phosphate synthase